VRQKLTSMSPRTAVALTSALYVVLIPVLMGAGDGYFTMVSLLPVVATGLLLGPRRGVQAALIFTPSNLAMVWLIEGSIASMTSAGGIMGTASLFALGGGVGYLNNLAKARLQQVVDEKDRLIGTISHELRTPLTTVVGLSHELAESIGEFSPQEISEFCRLIAQQSGELEALLEDLLVAARAELMGGRLEYRREGDWTHFDLVLPADRLLAPVA